MKEDFLKVIKELRKKKKRSFNQSLDLIVNLSKIDLRKENISILFKMPHPFKENKICAFLETKSSAVNRTITKAELNSLDKKEIKKIAKEYDFFIASAPLMPLVASSLGKILGPLGKMPNPKLGGVIMREEEASLKASAEKFRGKISLKAKELSLKASVGKENMKDEELAENASELYEAILKSLPQKSGNIKNVLLKFTMSKPFKVKIK